MTSNCCFPSTVPMDAAPQDRCCLQKPLTKAALFVIALLLAAGAIGASFGGWRIPGIVSFSIASGAAFILFAISCISKSNSSSSPSQKERDFNLHRAELSEGRKIEIELMTSLDLVSSLKNKHDLYPQSKDFLEQSLIQEVLGGKITGCFLRTNQEQIAPVLQPLFTAAGKDVIKLEALCDVILNQCRVTKLLNTVTILEQITWEDVNLKQKILSEACAKKIDELDYIVLDEGDRSKAYLNIDRICGAKDFVINPVPMPPALAQGIAIALYIFGRRFLEKLKQEKETGMLDPKAPIGFTVIFRNAEESRFPAEMILPIFPYLTNIPCLFGLDLSIVHGFKNMQLQALSGVCVTIPRLTRLEVNTDGMTEMFRHMYHSALVKILEERTVKPPTLESILSEHHGYGPT